MQVACAAPLRDLAPAFRDLPHLAVLEGGSDLSGHGRWSYLVADPVDSVSWNPAEMLGPAATSDGADGFAMLGKLLSPAADPIAGLPPFTGGAVGYLAYDAGYALERLPGRCPGAPPAGYLWAGIYDWVLARDGAGGGTWIVASDRGGRDPQALIAGVRRRLQPSRPAAPPAGIGPPRDRSGRPAFVAQVHAILDYISAGDCYQVNIARRLALTCPTPALDLFRNLSRAHPAPFGAYLDSGRLEVVSASPELFLRVRGRDAHSRPIKGTRPRGATPAADAKLARALCRSPKDRAENVMIVDVLRNDFGRVCRPGSIHVPELWAAEPHPSVWQLVSEVRGELCDEATAVDLLRVCSPAGSVTGAPKIRAMQIIDELEPVRRGVYCGSIFALGFDGSLTSSVAIRTLQVADGEAHLHVGSGIVADSDPEREFAETVHKARGILAALGLHE